MIKEKVSYNAKSVYSIDPNFFKDLGVKAVICDLDNTLDPADTLTPNPLAFKLKEELEKLNIKLVVISNNREKRVAHYCKALGVDYLSSSHKYLPFKIKKFLTKKLNLLVGECIFIGDQIFTDRIYVNQLKGRLILTEPLSKKDQFFTRFYRWLDRIVRNRWLKKGKLGRTCPIRK